MKGFNDLRESIKMSDFKILYLKRYMHILKVIDSCTTNEQLNATLNWAEQLFEYKRFAREIEVMKLNKSWISHEIAFEYANYIHDKILKAHHDKVDELLNDASTSYVKGTLKLIGMSKNFDQARNIIMDNMEKCPTAFENCNKRTLFNVFFMLINKM